jgi:GT2 family glycosyltransferase
VILVDDFSTDDSVGFVEKEFPWVRIQRRGENGGFARASNDGIRLAQGELIAILNNDTKMQPDWAEKATRPFANPEVGAVASLLIQADRPTHIDRAGDGYTLSGAAYNKLHGVILAQGIEGARMEDYSKRRSTPPPPGYPEVFGASAAAAIYRRKALVEVGLFDESFGAYYEDIDLAWRLHLKGWKVVLAGDAQGKHQSSATYVKGSPQFVRNSSRNSEIVFWTDMPAALLMRHVFNRFIYLGFQSMNRIRRGEIVPYIEGKMQFIRRLPSIIQRRRRLQDSRLTSANNIGKLLDDRWFLTLVRQFMRNLGR